MAGSAQRTIPRRLLEAAACALAAHALVYRAVLPNDGLHGYLAWYEPVVAGASMLSVLWLVATVLRAATSAPSARFGSTLGELFASTFVVLLLQESLERIAQAGRPIVAVTPAAMLALAAAAAVVAFVLAAARCLGRAALDAILRRVHHRVAHGLAQRWQPALAPVTRPRPLAERFGLRAPPVVAA